MTIRISGRTANGAGHGGGEGHWPCHCPEIWQRPGAAVILADRDAREGESAANELRELGFSARFMTLDVTQRGSVEAAADQLERDGIALDVLVNNAGIVRNAPASEMSIEDWQQVIDIDLTACFIVHRCLAAAWFRWGSGSIINITSMCGEIVVQPQPQISYNAAKAGANLLTKSLPWSGRRPACASMLSLPAIPRRN